MSKTPPIEGAEIVMLTVLILFTFSAAPVEAAGPVGYLGPGAGLTTIGALIAVVAMFFLALLGPILYPIRLLRRRYKKRLLNEGDNEVSSSVDDQPVEDESIV